MTEPLPDQMHRVFERHDSFVPKTEGYRVETTSFDNTITLAETDKPKATWIVTVTVPTIAAATADEVADIVVTDWFETLERRLADAPKATRATVELDGFTVERDGGEISIEYEFEWDTPERAADIAKTFVEYVEGTYVESIIPGYEYEPPVSNLLARASQSGKSGTPL